MDAQRRSKVLLAWCEGMTAERSERVAADVTHVHPPLGQARHSSQIEHAHMCMRGKVNVVIHVFAVALYNVHKTLHSM